MAVASLEELIGTYSGGGLSWEREDQGAEVGSSGSRSATGSALPRHAMPVASGPISDLLCAFFICIMAAFLTAGNP